MRASLFATLSILAIAFATAITASGRPRTPRSEPAKAKALYEPWLTPGENELTAEDLGRLIEALRTDLQASSIVDRAYRKIGATSAGELLKIVGLCDKGIVFEGKTEENSEIHFFFIARDLEEVARNFGAQLDQATVLAIYKAAITERLSAANIQDHGATQVRVEDDFIMYKIERRVPTRICIDRYAFRVGAEQMLLHELTHFTMTDESRFSLKDPLSYTNEREFMTDAMLEPGNEVDAYSTEYGYTIRKYGAATLPYMRLTKLYTDTGNFIATPQNRLSLANFILENLGYARRATQINWYEQNFQVAIQQEKQLRQNLVILKHERLLAKFDLEKKHPAAQAQALMTVVDESAKRLQAKIEQTEQRVAALVERNEGDT